MFYQCQKCKRVWQHPIQKCPYCFLKVKPLKSNKAKVIGISKVSIPTLLHPKVPYFVVLLEDEKGNRWVQKSKREYKIGEQLRYEPRTDKNTVSIWRVKYDVLEAIERVIELMGGIRIDQNSKILIVPTLVSPVHPHFAENTSPEVLEAVIKFLLQRGAKPENIKIGAQSFTEIPIEVSAQKSRLLEVCLKYKVVPLDLSKTKFILKKLNGFSFEISEEVFNHDFVINLPTLNLDLKLGVRGATENLTRLLKKESYFSLKYLYSEEKILENISSILPESLLNIADGISVQKTNKIAAFLGLVFGSFDPLNLDRVFAEVCMREDLPEYLKKVRIDDILVVGREIEEVQYNIETS